MVGLIRCPFCQREIKLEVVEPILVESREERKSRIEPITRDTPIEDFCEWAEVGVRTYNVLTQAYVRFSTVADVLDAGKNGLLRVRNCGRVTVQEIEVGLKRAGFALHEFPMEARK